MQKCDDKYIGESERPLKIRFSEHKGYVENNKLNEATGEHFNKKGHSSSDMMITILEKVKSNDEIYRKEREKYHIRIFNTYYKGMNKSPGLL